MKKRISLYVVLFILLSLIISITIYARSSSCLKLVSGDEVSRDDDFDGYPNFVEKGAGFDAYKDDCLAKMKCGKIPDLTRVGGQKNILIILDASGSMRARSRSGISRMEAAKEALKAYINILPGDSRVGLLVYSARGFDGRRCKRIKLVSEIQRLNKQVVTQQINEISQGGLTPMAEAIKRAGTILEKYAGQDNHIILISDGLESCNGNPVQEVYNLKNSKAKPQVDVIGFGIRGRARRQLNCMAEVSGGKYHYVNSAKSLTKVLKQSFLRSRNFYRVMVCLNKDFNNYSICETAKYNKADQWIMMKGMMASGAKKRQFEQAKKIIKKRYDEIMKLSLSKLKAKAKKIKKDTK